MLPAGSVLVVLGTQEELATLSQLAAGDPGDRVRNKV